MKEYFIFLVLMSFVSPSGLFAEEVPLVKTINTVNSTTVDGQVIEESETTADAFGNAKTKRKERMNNCLGDEEGFKNVCNGLLESSQPACIAAAIYVAACAKKMDSQKSESECMACSRYFTPTWVPPKQVTTCDPSSQCGKVRTDVGGEWETRSRALKVIGD